MNKLMEKDLEEVRITKRPNTYIKTSRIYNEYNYPLTRQGIVDYISELKEKGNVESTVFGKVAIIKSFIRRNRQYIDNADEMLKIINMVSNDKPAQAYATQEQVEAIIKESKPIYKLLFALCYYGGMRISEALALTTQDIKDTSIIVRQTKTHTGRIIPVLSETLSKLIEQFHVLPRNNDDLVFPINKNTAQVYFKRVARRLGYDDLHIHSLRAGFVTKALEKDVDMTTIMSITGHKALSSIQSYAHVTDAMKAKAKNIFS